MAEWSKAPVLKTGEASVSVGSNPTPSATHSRPPGCRISDSRFRIPRPSGHPLVTAGHRGHRPRVTAGSAIGRWAHRNQRTEANARAGARHRRNRSAAPGRHICDGARHRHVEGAGEDYRLRPTAYCPPPHTFTLDPAGRTIPLPEPERCWSGRSGLPAKQLSGATWTAGSNPALSANPLTAESRRVFFGVRPWQLL